MLSIEPIELFF